MPRPIHHAGWAVIRFVSAPGRHLPLSNSHPLRRINTQAILAGTLTRSAGRLPRADCPASPGLHRYAPPRLYPWSEPEGDTRAQDQTGAMGRPGELGPDPHVPDHPRGQLVSYANLHSDDGRLASPRGLLGEDVAHERRPGELWGADRITRAQSQLVAPVTLIPGGRGQELVSPVEVQAQALDGLRDDALELDAVSSRSDTRRRINANLQGQGREAHRLLIEVVERTHLA